MLRNKNRSNVFFLSFILLIIFMSNIACAGTIRLPDKTAAVLIVDQKGKITPVDSNGERIGPCRLKSEVDQKLPLCESTVDSTDLGGGDFVMLIPKHKNPCYMTMYISGYRFEIPIPCPPNN